MTKFRFHNKTKKKGAAALVVAAILATVMLFTACPNAAGGSSGGGNSGGGNSGGGGTPDGIEGVWKLLSTKTNDDHGHVPRNSAGQFYTAAVSLLFGRQNV